MSPDARLAALRGRWRTLRVLRHADGARARFGGFTTWSPMNGGGLRCLEEGTLRQDGRSFPAGRETLWQAGPGGIEVRFADGRPFHTVGRDAAARHDCAPDIYWLRYDWSAWPRWSVRWRVRGPRKDYRALTRYLRAD